MNSSVPAISEADIYTKCTINESLQTFEKKTTSKLKKSLVKWVHVYLLQLMLVLLIPLLEILIIVRMKLP